MNCKTSFSVVSFQAPNCLKDLKTIHLSKSKLSKTPTTTKIMKILMNMFLPNWLKLFAERTTYKNPFTNKINVLDCIVQK